MEHIKTKQGLMAHFIRSQHKEPNIFPDEGGITHDGCSHGDSPVSQLIPGKEISRITEAEGEDEEGRFQSPS